MSATSNGYDIVAIGASAGGLQAVCRLVRQLPSDFTIPVAVVQHRARESSALAELLQDCTGLHVCEVEDKQPVEPRHVYVAPPDYHLLVDDGEFALSTEGPVGYSRPSIDVFFDSVADGYGATAIGVVLTGANGDGSRGLVKIVSRGGQALVQDPTEAEVAVMPSSAKRAVPRALVLRIDGIAEHLKQLHGLQQASGAT